ncbi:MAG: hypothetical protein HC933_09610 [Pleurocapsa sp. SU_196_0]|nr:hypothetical protein [Pleurocapsa sp. SU_196_0]
MNALRFATVMLIASLMTACHQQRVLRGDLSISAPGIPDLQNARVTILRPDATTRTLTVRGGQSQLLEDLPVGSYTITPSAIVGFKTPALER